MKRLNLSIWVFFLLCIFSNKVFSQYIQYESLPLKSKVYFVKTTPTNVYGVQANKIRNAGALAWKIDLITKNKSNWKLESAFVLNGTGSSLVIKDLAQVQNNIYIAGNFGDSNNNYSILRYNLITKTWDIPFKKLETGQINGLASHHNYLIVVGSFFKFNKISASNLIIYNQLKDSFYTIGNGFIKGTNGAITHIANINDSVIISGRFNKIGDSVRFNIALILLNTKNTFALQTDSILVTGLQVLQSSFYISSIKNGVNSLQNIFTNKKVMKLNSDSFCILKNIVATDKSIIWQVLQRKGTHLFTFKNDSLFPFKNQSIFSLTNYISTNGKQIFVTGDRTSTSTESASFSGLLNFAKQSVIAFIYWDKNKNNQYNVGIDIPLQGLAIKKKFSRTLVFTSNLGIVQWIDDIQNSILEFEIKNYKRLVPSKSFYKINLDTLAHPSFNIPIQFNTDSISDFGIKIILPSGNSRIRNLNNKLQLVVSNEGEKTKPVSFELVLNEKLTFVSSSIPPNSSISNKLIWRNILIPFGETKIIKIVTVASDTSLKINNQLNYAASIISIDNYTENNTDNNFQQIALIEEFNDIKIQKTKSGNTQNYVNITKTDSFIDYQIRAVNTGTDSIHTLVIEDTIPIPLPVTQIQLLASSHPFNYSVSSIDNNTKLVLRYFFSEVNLTPNPSKNSEIVTSATNIILRVYFESSIPTNYEFTNTAFITKNNQNKLATNTVRALVSLTSIKNISVFSLNAYPNPFDNYLTIPIELPFKGYLYNNLGVKLIQFDSQKVNLSNIPFGTYVLQVNKGNSVYKQIIIK